MLLSEDEMKVNVVSFETAQLMLQNPAAVYVPGDFIDTKLRQNHEFGSKHFDFSIRASEFISCQFGKKFSGEALIETNTLSQAVWFLYWTELCNIIPIRSVLRESRELFYNKAVLIPLPSKKITILEEWKENSAVLPLIMYFELQKIGATPLLVSPPRQEPDTLELNINPGIINTQILTKDGVLFCPKATRGTQHAVKLIWEDLGANQKIGNLLLSLKNWPSTNVQIKLQKHDLNFGAEKIKLYQSSLPWSKYSDLIKLEFMKIIQFTYKTIDQLAVNSSIFEANICDHLFVDTALIAGCIRSRGGKVKLWPHSASMPLLNHHKVAPSAIVRVYKDKEIRHPSFHSTKTLVHSELMFTPPSIVRNTNNDKKQNLILIGGGTKINQLPMFDIVGHENTTKTFLSELSKRQHKINVYVRPKGHWSTFEWFQNLADFTLIEAPDSPSKIDLPNMTFVCISQTSTALIEGVGRGIPGIIIKEINAFDYFPLEESFFPQMTVKDALATIDSFDNSKSYEKYWRKQIGWFEKYTQFN
jgi:hypothetical protein